MRRRQAKLTLSKETVRHLIQTELHVVVGGIQCRRISYGVGSACDCSGSATASGTCGDCSTIQY